MDGRKLGFGLGVFVVVAALGVVALIDHSKAPSKPKAAPAPAKKTSTDSPTQPPTVPELKKSFGGLVYRRVGGIAGFNDSVTVDPDFRAAVSTKMGTSTSKLSAAESLKLLRSLNTLAQHPPTSKSDDSEPYPDQMTTEGTFVWDGEIVAINASDPAAEFVTTTIDELLKSASAR